MVGFSRTIEVQKDTAGHSGVIGVLRQSAGGGMAIFGTATGDNTSVTGNQASTFPNIDGTLST